LFLLFIKGVGRKHRQEKGESQRGERRETNQLWEARGKAKAYLLQKMAPPMAENCKSKAIRRSCRGKKKP